jgi:hypothetical protein
MAALAHFCIVNCKRGGVLLADALLRAAQRRRREGRFLALLERPAERSHICPLRPARSHCIGRIARES